MLHHPQEQHTCLNHSNYGGGIPEKRSGKEGQMLGADSLNELIDHYTMVYGEEKPENPLPSTMAP